MIIVVDYGMGNLKSVENAARTLGKPVKVTSSPSVVKKAKKIIFPGVGHFGRTILELKKRGLFSVLKAKIKEGAPFLGICIGMQALFDSSEEARGVKGLGIIPGKVKKFKGLITPHMGWNQVRLSTIGYRPLAKSLFKGVKDDSFFYFVHSYYCEPKNKEVIFATTDYGRKFASCVHRDNIWAIQFHIEKSQKTGLKIFNNFLKL